MTLSFHNISNRCAEVLHVFAESSIGGVIYHCEHPLHNYKLDTIDWFWMRVNARDYIRNKEFFEINQTFPDISSISATEEVSLLSKFNVKCVIN